ncbi:hypothetical protein [Ectopseudomonas oleovorans]|jgi:hypothetical protein|uniref:hypothetical protein n=1 Tax=Ectopseudomonas oleovorans TaxID=301 RepID=UPI00241D512D|nr:hypothetical protein [Pseudomonas oleovorans]
MPSNSKEYFYLMVEPTVKEFINSPNSLRRGLLAALILNHMIDHLAQENEPAADRITMNERVKAKRNEIIGACHEFQFIWDVADSIKHAKLTAKKSREVSSSSQLTGSAGLFQAPFGEGVFSDAVEIFAVVDNGLEKPLLPAVIAVFENLRSIIVGQVVSQPN